MRINLKLEHHYIQAIYFKFFMFVNDPESDVGGGDGGSSDCTSAAAAVDDDVEEENAWG